MLDHRENLAKRTAEHWRPPVFRKSVTDWNRFTAAIRRFFDLQAGSIWRDLAIELPKVRGCLLDVGCGAQPYRELLSPEVRYLGIDTDDAKEHFGYIVPDTIYYSGDTWPVETESMDFVLCTEALEHVIDPAAFLREMHRCLKPGGRLILTVPFSARWHFIPYDYWRFTPSGLNRLLEREQFTDVCVYARGNALTVACYKVEALMLPLLFPQGSRLLRKCASLLLGLLVSPLFILMALIGTITLVLPGGDDCLGYTALASRRLSQ